VAAQHFAEAPDTHRRVAPGKRNQIFNAATHLDSGWRHKTDAARADIAGLLLTIHPLVAQLDDM
jgi:hypothetical protein